jgi:cis-3-alkyl-4-acyloxetan-2-one decarboxylase
MVHGNPTWSFFFRSLISNLAPFYRVIAPDHIGCGLSEKPGISSYGYRLKDRVNDLAQLIDHLDVKEKLTLVLHDWGGMIGAAYALRNLERIGRLVIMNTAAFLKPHGKRLPLRLRLIRDFSFFAVPAVLGLNLFVRGALLMASAKPLSREARTGLTAPYDRPRNRIATLKFVQDIPLRPVDPSYPLARSVDENLNLLRGIPMLILWGERDFVFDLDYLGEWRRRFPEAEAHTFPRAGHYLLEDAPDEISLSVSDFLSRHPL